jgi:sec-independent protein translocase protein TatC
MTDRGAPVAEARERGEMPFLDHLEELRWRLLKALIAVVVGVVAGYAIVTQFDVIALLKTPIDPFLPAGRKLLFTSPLDPFVLTLKLALVVGLLIASPVLVWQAWGFLRPALYERERRAIVPVSLLGVGLFLVGAAAAFVWVLPLALKVLLGFQSQSLEGFITATEYFSLATTVVLSFGAIFELPLVLVLLVYLRVISAAFLRRHRRTFVIANAILSSVLTPGDIVVMTAVVMLPVQLFYELSIVLATMLEKRRARAAAPGTADTSPAPGPA